MPKESFRNELRKILGCVLNNLTTSYEFDKTAEDELLGIIVKVYFEGFKNGRKVGTAEQEKEVEIK